ncbi:calcium/sodium antiporter [Conchiformibius kuhniae]|uniref:Calcium/sodium antiporter n=1 Tax=Conchiformibius kuhniae TaxID=211502 RepID=A0A8T9MSU1_9NEIS|nr:calcium/sodium antiporter [Conchiformibius kuhniae]UOP04341.1 calcium/sodium antiporter [Conchiformibius kuhniae]
MLYAALAVLFGLAVLVWSADRFIDGAAATTRHFGMPPLLVGMVIVGFGTSAPEMVVSVLSATDGSPGIALGNAYGSNITNIALILGITALISPIAVQKQILRGEMPVLLAVTLLTAILLWDKDLSRTDGWLMLAVLAGYMTHSVWQAWRGNTAPAEANDHGELLPLKQGIAWLLAGLALLVASSRLLVWGATGIAQNLGVSDLLIGLTVVAIGTSLPELASSVMAAKKGEHDIAVGNVIGSNLFNTLAVVGLAATIHPMPVAAEILHRDLPVMGALTLLLPLLCLNGSIGRIKGAILFAAYLAYTACLLLQVL